MWNHPACPGHMHIDAIHVNPGRRASQPVSVSLNQKRGAHIMLNTCININMRLSGGMGSLHKGAGGQGFA